MPVGQLVKKFVWLLDNVEVKGIVRVAKEDGERVPDGTPPPLDGTGNQPDDFDIELDDNYKHLVALVPSNNPPIWYNKATSPSMACIHCETYPEAAQSPDSINRVEPWELPKKADSAPFVARNQATGRQDILKVGDHVRIVGRWVIDHHPESCVTRERGWLRVGCVWMELHPFRWDNITLVRDLAPGDTEVETLSLAAPIHEEVYLGGWKWVANEVAGVASKIFITEDGSNYHNSTIANILIKAPQLPAGFVPDSNLIEFQEEILVNGTQLDVSQIRHVTIVPDGIKVEATIIAPIAQYVDGLGIADINDPANGKSVFQARYTVRWKPRLIAVDSRGLAGDQLDTIQLAAQATGGSYPFLIYLANRGPDALRLTKIEIKDDPNSIFQIDPAITFPLPVPQMSVLTLKATFSPKKAGSVTAKLVVHNNDPVQEVLFVELTSAGTGDLAQVEVSPLNLDFGLVRVGTVGSRPITIRNIGNVNASVSEMTTSLASAFQPPLVNQPRILPPGQSQVIDIFYAPTQRGASLGNANLFVQGSSLVSQEIAIALKGQGSAPILVVDPPIMDFGAVPPSTAKTLPLRILNNGDASLTVNAILVILSTGRAFFLDPAQVFPLSVAPTSSVTLQITYYAGPTPGQTYDDEWEVESDDPIYPRFRLLLRGIAGGSRIDVLPGFIDFHHVQQVPALVGVTIRNDGSSDLVVERTVLENGTNFSLVGIPHTPVTIAAGSQLVFQVQFQAQMLGLYHDRLIVYSNDARRGQVRNMIEAILG